MRISKKVLSIVLSILMAFSMMPFTVFAADAPKATVEEITAPEGIKKAYKFTANAASPTDYDSYHADFEVYFDKDIKAGEVTLYGKYGSYDWTPITINEDLPHGQTIRLVDKFLGQKLTYAEIRDNVSPFYCGINTAKADGVNAIVRFKLYQVNAAGNETGVTALASDTVAPYIAADPVPQATVTEVTSLPQGIQRAFKFEAPADSPTVYDNYHADFVLTFRKAIEAGEVILWGKYGSYDWTPIVLDRAVAKGESVRLVDEFLNQKLTYAEIRDSIGTFYCGLTSHSNDAFNVDVELKLFPVNDAGQESGDPLDAGAKYPYIFANPLPTATVTEVDAPEGAAFAYKFEAPSGNSFYDGYHADFVATFDRDIKAGEVTLYGKYGSYDWTPIVINRDIDAGEEFRIVEEFLNDTLTYGTVRNDVSPFYCGAGGAVLANTSMNVEFKLFAVDASGNEIEDAGTSAQAANTIPATAPEVPQATVTPEEAPEGAAFAYKFEAPAQNPTAYDAYKADFVVSFDRDVKAGEVTLWGKYGDYDWTPVVIDRDVAEGEEFRLVQEFLGQDLTYAEIRDGVSPFYCGAGGDVLADTNVSVQLKLYPASGEPVDASDEITDDIAEPLPQADVTDAVAPADVVEAFTFTTPHDSTTVEDSKYKNYRCDFVVTFEKDIAAGDVILTGSYGDYGWVDMPAQDYEAGTEYRLLSILGDSIDYETLCKDVSPFTCGYKGAAAEDTGMKVELRFYDVSTGEEVYAGTSAEVETTVPAAPEVHAPDAYSIIAGDQVELNIYVAKTDDINSIDLTYNSTPDKEAYTEVKTALDLEDLPVYNYQGVDYYVVNVKLAPAQIWDEITVDVHAAYNERSITKSIADYCNDIVVNNAYTGEKAAEVKALASAILSYGKACYEFFKSQGKYTSLAADAAVGGIDIPAATFEDTYDCTLTEGTEVRYVATAVPELRFVIPDVTEADAVAANKNITSSVGTAKFKKYSDGTIALCISGITAAQLVNTITVSGAYNFKFNPMLWAKLATQVVDTNALGNAVANYAAAANAYFGN